jgi:hypothetical protein
LPRTDLVAFYKFHFVNNETRVQPGSRLARPVSDNSQVAKILYFEMKASHAPIIDRVIGLLIAANAFARIRKYLDRSTCIRAGNY